MPAFPLSITSLAYGVRRAIANLILPLSISACALTGPAVSLAQDRPVVLALGDSLTAGYGLVRSEDGLVPQLQAWVDAEGVPMQIVNAGVSGDTTAGGLSRLDWSLDPQVDAMMVILGGNDLLRGTDPAATRANLDAILAKAQARGLPVLLVGLTASNNYGPEFKAQFDAIYPELAAKYGALLEPNFFAPLGADLSSMRPLMQPDGIHPNPQGVAKVVAVLGPRLLELLAKVPATAG